VEELNKKKKEIQKSVIVLSNSLHNLGACRLTKIVEIGCNFSMSKLFDIKPIFPASYSECNILAKLSIP